MRTKLTVDEFTTFLDQVDKDRDGLIQVEDLVTFAEEKESDDLLYAILKAGEERTVRRKEERKIKEQQMNNSPLKEKDIK